MKSKINTTPSAPPKADQYEYFISDHLEELTVSFAKRKESHTKWLCSEGIATYWIATSTSLCKDNGSNVALKTAITDRDPFGIVLKNTQLLNGMQNRHEYQGKETEMTFGLNRVNLGARTYNSTIARFDKVDALSEKYLKFSPYVYVHNNPANAIDPDGRLVIFVNGQHGKFANGISSYWGSFGNSVMEHLNDRNAKYYDGAMGGWNNTALSTLNNNLFPSNRYAEGYDKGYKDAAGMISKLARDPDGNIIETIKIITHSMGGVFGSGLQAGIKKYLKQHPVNSPPMFRQQSY
jgi:RHS repeat-associated protein